MTVHIAVAIKDSAVQAFNRPFFVPSTAVAVRSFMHEVNRQAEDNAMYWHAEDFELWVVGAFDDEAGEFVPAERRCLARAKDVNQV